MTTLFSRARVLLLVLTLVGSALLGLPMSVSHAADCPVTSNTGTVEEDGTTKISTACPSKDSCTLGRQLSMYIQNFDCTQTITLKKEGTIDYSGLAKPVPIYKSNTYSPTNALIIAATKAVKIKADNAGELHSCLLNFDESIMPITLDLEKITLEVGKKGTQNYRVDADALCGDGLSNVTVCDKFGGTGMKLCSPASIWQLWTVSDTGAEPDTGEEGVDADGDGYDSEDSGGNDCNDDDATIHPGAVEIPGDGIDQDCDGSDGDYPDSQEDNDYDGYCENSTYTTDSDTNGYCTADDTKTSATPDCNDDADDGADIHPGADEHANDIDDDCDGKTDEDYVDGDDDCVCADNPDGLNYDSACDTDANVDGTPDYAGDGECDSAKNLDTATDDTDYDCDDTKPTVSPLHGGKDTATGDGLDNDCDGSVDEDAAPPPTTPTTPTTPPTTEPVDADGDDDGYASEPSGGSDCDDSNAAIYPGNAETLDNGIDDDCDASTLDSSTTIEEATDVDRDGIPDESDNCPEVANEGQADCDQDLAGNDCDETPTGELSDEEIAAQCEDLAPSESGEEEAYAGGCSLVAGI